MSEKFEEMSIEEEENITAHVDALVDYLKELPHDDVFILNPKRVEQMKFSYAMLLKSIAGIEKEVSITYGISEFDRTMASIKLEGRDLEVCDIERFSRAAEFADSTDIYPLVEDKIRMTFTFHGIYASAMSHD